MSEVYICYPSFGKAEELHILHILQAVKLVAPLNFDNYPSFHAIPNTLDLPLSFQRSYIWLPDYPCSSERFQPSALFQGRHPHFEY
jgi:hypothetical protein